MFLFCGDAAKFITHNGFRGAISRRLAAKSRLCNSSSFVEKKMSAYFVFISTVS